MNLLTDVPIHRLFQKITNKKANAECECLLNHFSIYDILNMVGDGLCQYTGKSFKNLADMTFERVNPNKGYVQGNVIMVTLAANQCKAKLDAFIKDEEIPDAMKVKLLRKAIYQLEKSMK